MPLAQAQQDDLSVLETTVINEAQQKALKGEGRVLDLRSVLEEAFRRNPFEQIRGIQKEQIELTKTDLFQDFWLPSIGLELNTSNHRIDRLRESRLSSPGMGAQTAPRGSLGLSIGEYNLFNWGRDYLQYQNQKQVLSRAGEQLLEERRRLKFALISQYFNLVRVREISKILQEQLRQTSFIHRLAREKLQLRKIRAQEYYQTRSEYLRSQTEYQQGLFEVGTEEENMSNLIGDEYRGAYRPDRTT
jgi:outer membrane protein TolC